MIISVPQFEEALRQDERNAGLFVLDVREPVAEPQSVKPEDAPPENAQPNGQPEISQAETDRPGQSAPDAAFYPGEKTGLPYDVVIQTIPTPVQEREPQTAAEQEIGNHDEITGGQRDTGHTETATQPEPADSPEAAEIKIPANENFRITDDHLGEGSQREKFRANMSAIYTLKAIEAEGRSATKEEQEILSRYVGWGGLPNVFDPDKAAWNREYQELKAALTEEEYRAANASVLNAHYTSPTVIKAVYEAIENMGKRATFWSPPAVSATS